VRRCLNSAFNALTSITVGNVTTDIGNFNADSNGNGIGVGVNEGNQNYQTGMVLDAIAAAGTPNALLPAGTLLAPQTSAVTGTGAAGAYVYKDAVFDMVDYYSYCEAPADGFSGTPTGGWHYSCQETVGDNSASQWAAIGIIPARRKVGAPFTVDPLPSL